MTSAGGAIYSDDTVEAIASDGAFYNKTVRRRPDLDLQRDRDRHRRGLEQAGGRWLLGSGSHGGNGGQALVELSLCAGFLCLMLLAVWQVGTIFSNFINISEAARSGARAAALSGAPSTTNDAPSLAAAKSEGAVRGHQLRERARHGRDDRTGRQLDGGRQGARDRHGARTR